MAKEPSTRRAARDHEVTDRAIRAVVVAVLADRAGRTYPLPKGRRRDITATIRQNTRAAVARRPQAGSKAQHGSDRDPAGALDIEVSVIDPGAARAATAECVMERLSGFAQGSGVSGRVACQIIEWVIASPTDRRRRRPVGKARTCILIAPG